MRQIVHTSIGGTSARIQMSNAFGTQPVTIRDVHPARRTSDSGVDPATDRVVTFGGQRSVTIPAGSLAVSDAVDLAIPADADMAVSIHLPQPTGPATYHQTSTQTNYIASGDVSGNATLTGAKTAGSYYYDLINDLTSTSPPVPASQLIDALKQLITRAHAKGVKFVCSTLTPYAAKALFEALYGRAQSVFDVLSHGVGDLVPTAPQGPHAF